MKFCNSFESFLLDNEIVPIGGVFCTGKMNGLIFEVVQEVWYRENGWINFDSGFESFLLDNEGMPVGGVFCTGKVDGLIFEVVQGVQYREMVMIRFFQWFW